MRRKLAQESYEEKIRKVGMLIRLIKKTPKLGKAKIGHADTVSLTNK